MNGNWQPFSPLTDSLPGEDNNSLAGLIRQTLSANALTVFISNASGSKQATPTTGWRKPTGIREMVRSPWFATVAMGKGGWLSCPSKISSTLLGRTVR